MPTTLPTMTRKERSRCGIADQVAVVNGHSNGSVDLSLVPSKLQQNTNPRLIQPLTITNLSPAPSHGSTLRVAYQGIPGAYFEATAGKTYPKSEAILCDQFDVVFQAVELWIVDRVVFLVENSLGGSKPRELRSPPRSPLSPRSFRSPY
ncbi:hypothetical protein ISN44_As06g034040 [Arabidopsis suecica]|uniref:Prephenate dehydratase domain-containing protein n=1 Tax=Arabidopsis suecica TaxID=45249 RepID=A0A8T2CLU1_ARASU|nr:hypothetical protein ISN44_As06g034040 [Arabidopsis suecica]